MTLLEDPADLQKLSNFAQKAEEEIHDNKQGAILICWQRRLDQTRLHQSCSKILKNLDV